MKQTAPRPISDRLPRREPTSTPGPPKGAPLPVVDRAAAIDPTTSERVPASVPAPTELAAPTAVAGATAEVRRAGRLARYVGVLIATICIGAALVLWLLASARVSDVEEAPRTASFFGRWEFTYDPQVPAITLVLGAIGLGLLFAAAAAVVERVVLDRSRRSTDAETKLLAPRLVMAETRGVFAGPVTVTVLIPAHDEAASIGATLTSLAAQEPAPDRVIVVADNCTDDTAAIARAHGAEVFATVGNTEKKAGALNQALRGLLGEMGDNDVVMCMDADTVLDPGFLEAGIQRFTGDRALMAIGGLFYGEEGHGLIGQLQRNEYVRYSREIKRRRGRVFVLTGTASMFRSRALRTVAASRGTILPGVNGDVYDTAALTEDNELTLAIKSLGGLMASPDGCRVVTELMPTWRNLWTQRLRWQRGALENLGAYGPTPTMLRYWAQQLGIGYSVIALSAFWLLIGVTAVSTDRWVWFPFWLGVGSIFVVDRVISAWKGGWRARLLAALLVPELLYDMYLDLVYVKGILDITFARTATWGHVAHGTASGPSPQGEGRSDVGAAAGVSS
ncbi:glycosyltransferase family 2 protein [Dermatobacter hominis]|uniref:glycosyltransferase family 2 protein n=1 Tax=Dermatobacter hominis TaxID=2884263 RepID=UPI001D101BB8|nr:glycosyltransferase family 2 protein [Dermatobacter hominis]UDY36726.1 glycosyltransferase [Dermatobacter hominis]